MNKEIEQNESNSSTLIERESYKKTIGQYNKTIDDLNKDTKVLQDDVAEKDAEILKLKTEAGAEKARRIRAENLINESKKSDVKSYAQTKQEQFEDTFTRKWDQRVNNGR